MRSRSQAWATPGLDHAKSRAPVLEEWQSAIADNAPSATFVLKARYTYGQDLVKQDQVSSPAAADVSDYYGYDALGSVRYLIQQSAGCPSLDQRREGFLCLCSGSAQAYRTGMALELA